MIQNFIYKKVDNYLIITSKSRATVKHLARLNTV
jgi:hypothetical protein